MKMIFMIILLISIAAPANAKRDGYKQFGGKKAITKVVNDFILGLIQDKRIKKFFKKTNKKVFKRQLSLQICQELGGPCKYDGPSMKKIHKGLKINREHFYALVENLQIAMDNNNIPSAAQNKLLSRLAPMHKDIVTK